MLQIICDWVREFAKCFRQNQRVNHKSFLMEIIDDAKTDGFVFQSSYDQDESGIPNLHTRNSSPSKYICSCKDHKNLVNQPDGGKCKNLRKEKKELENDPMHLRGDFLELILFPRRISTARGKTGHGLASGDLIQKLFCPGHTPINIKLFGSKRAIEVERERWRKSGYIIHPCSKLRQYWDLIIMAMLVLNMFIMPLDIAFFTDSYEREWLAFHICSDFLCIIDIILNFRTGYRSSEELNDFELDQKKIAVHYLKTWFGLDLLSSLPFHYIILLVSGSTENLSLGLKGASRALKFLKVAKLLNLLKLLRLSRIIRGVAQYEEVYSLTTTFMRYIKLICMMLLVAHWNGCLHFLVPMMQDFPADCWVRLCKLEHESWYVQYGWALFKTLSHMLCIGYGRFIPVLLSEAVITIFSMVTGATFYALFIAHSMAFIIQHDSSKSTYQEKEKKIDEYMSYRNLPDATKKKVRNYFERKYHHGRFFDEDQILSEISPPLRDEIVNHTCRDLVKSIPFLRTSPTSFVSSLLNKLTYEVYLSGDVIITEGSVSDAMFFMRKGNAELTIRKEFVQNVVQGGYFGEIGLLTKTRQLFTVQANTTCDVFMLANTDLDDLLHEFSSMKVVFEHTAIYKLIQIGSQCLQLKPQFMSSSENESKVRPPNQLELHLMNALSYFKRDKSDVTDENMNLVHSFQTAIEQHRKDHKTCNICQQCFNSIDESKL